MCTEFEKYKNICSKYLERRGYTLSERIGQGSFGVIVMARSKRHHSQMAIKIIEKPSDYKQNECNFHWSITNENKFAHTFDHPYINGYHEIIETSKRLYYVMDFYKNGTLLDYSLEVDRTPEWLAYKWFAQLCAALEYVHWYGWAHRDVKMDNVLLDDRQRVRLADFGMCTFTGRPSHGNGGGREAVDTSICGSKPYMSPELLAGAPYNGQLADVWATGVVLFCLVTGRFPFGDGDDKDQLIQNQRNEHFFDGSDIQVLPADLRLFFNNIFVVEKKRKKIHELYKDNWMNKMSRVIKVQYFE